MDDEELEARLRYLETWGMAYMYLWFAAFVIVCIGLVILVAKS